MRNKQFVFYLTFITTALLFAVSFNASAAEVSRVSTDELKSNLGAKGLLILDVRSQGDWVGSNVKIATAERVELTQVEQWADSHSREDTVVLYCT